MVTLEHGEIWMNNYDKSTKNIRRNYVGKKEAETRKRMSNEYKRLRSNSKKTYDDTTDAVKKQNDIYTRELKELNNYR